jgi:hypothetical protein
LGRELDKRLRKLEQALPEERARTPYREDFERRVRIAELYQAWWFEGGEKPDLSHPRDEHWWAYMEQIRRVIEDMAVEGALDSYPSEQEVP